MIWMTLAFAAPTPVAVMAFDNNSGDPRYDAVGFGLQDMLVTDLAVVDDLQLVERDRLSDVLDELELGQSAYVDPKTAARIGKVVSARWVVTGGLIAMDPVMRLDARVVDVKTGKIIANAKTEGPTEEFFLLEKELASGLLDALDVDVPARANARMGRVQTESFDAFMSYAKGLEALDAGELERAAEALKAALAEDSRFASAETVLGSFRTEVERLSEANVEATSDMARLSLKELERIESNEDWEALRPFLIQLDPRLHSMPRDDWRSIGKQLLAMHYPEPFLPRAESKATAREYAMYLVIVSGLDTGRHAEVLEYGQRFMERYPASALFGNVQRTVTQVIASEAAMAEGAKRAEADIAAATYEHYLEDCKRYEDPSLCARASKFGGRSDAVLIDAWVEAIEESGTRDDVRVFVRANGKNDELDELMRDAEATRAAASTDPRDLDERAIALYRLGDSKGASKTLVSTLEASTDSRVWRRGLRVVGRFGDVALAERLQSGAEAVEESYGAKGALERARRRSAMSARFEPDELFEAAKITHDLKLHGRSSALFLELADRFPDYVPCSAAHALYSAASNMSQSNIEGKNRKARALYERVVAEHPESTWATPSRSLLQTLPR